LEPVPGGAGEEGRMKRQIGDMADTAMDVIIIGFVGLFVAAVAFVGC